MRLLVLLSACCLLLPLTRVAAQPVPDSATAAKSKAPADTTAKTRKPKEPYVHQLRIGVDIARLAFNMMWPSRQGYELQGDYRISKKAYLAAEAGFGKGKINYDNLKYDNNGYFFRAGIDQQFLDIVSVKDFDIGFIGARYGIGFGKRGEASYLVPSPFGPPAEGRVDPQQYVVHWGELTGGIKVEFWKGFFAGWNIRGKFMLNSGIFKELAPNYIPGYGKGDKSTVFDFSFYLSYAMRWGGQ